MANRVDAAGEQADGTRGAPAPIVGLGHPQQHGGERGGQESSADPVDAHASRCRRGRHQAVSRQGGGQRDQTDPEEPLDPDSVGDHARERQPDACADPEDRANEPQTAGHLVGRERVADDPERQREHAAGHALDHAAQDQHRDRVGERADHAANREQQQHEREHAALPVDVAELAHDRCRDRGRQEEPAEDPRRGGRAGINVGGDVRQRGDHERLRQRKRHARHQEHHQHPNRMLDRLGRARRHFVAHRNEASSRPRQAGVPLANHRQRRYGAQMARGLALAVVASSWSRPRPAWRRSTS